MVTDLSNELPLVDEWDPKLVHSPAQEEVPEPVYLDKDTPLEKAKPMAVSIPTTAGGRADCFIDDIVKCFYALDDVIQRQASAAPLAAFLSMRPHAGKNESIPRKEPLNQEKMAAEGIPNEVQIVLGWLLNTRLLILCLPKDKYIAYCRDIDEIIAKGRVTKKELESILGKLIHSSYVIPLARHFLSRLRAKLKKMNDESVLRFQHWMLHKEELEDLALWKRMLRHAHVGISLNGLTIRNPTRIGFSDSCPKGLGGFTVPTGTAWRLKVQETSPIYNDDTANSPLEFLGMVITLWLSLLDCKALGLKHELILLLGDSTSAICWMFKSSLPTDSCYYKTVTFLARKVADLSIEFDQFIASQHVKGCQNVISD